MNRNYSSDKELFWCKIHFAPPYSKTIIIRLILEVVCTPLTDYCLTTFEKFNMPYFALICVFWGNFKSDTHSCYTQFTLANHGILRQIGRNCTLIKIMFVCHGNDSRTLYKPQYSFVNLGKSRSVEKYKTTKRLLFNGFKISFYALSLIGLERTLLLPTYR